MAIIIILLVLMSACSSVPARRSLGPANDVADKIGDVSKPDVYRVGELEILVYRDREAMVPELPDLPKLVDGLRIGSKQLKIYGYYDKAKKRIYTVNDIGTLIHELKHFLEPDWEHAAPALGDISADELQNAESTVRNPRESPPDQKPLPKISCLPTCLR